MICFKICSNFTSFLSLLNRLNLFPFEESSFQAIYIFIRSSKYDSFHIFQFMSFPPLGILVTVTMTCSSVGLISSVDS